MHISLRARLDSARDRFVIEFEPPTEGTTRQPIKVEGLTEPVDLLVDADGYIVAVEIPDLKLGLAALAGAAPEAPGKAGKPPLAGKPGKPGK